MRRWGLGISLALWGLTTLVPFAVQAEEKTPAPAAAAPAPVEASAMVVSIPSSGERTADRSGAATGTASDVAK
ncbi:MAG TPA: hypothetical protein PKD69_08780, partial [Elusimicrobiota bacterium]|nr:hypothetical protein [Elusimicrobiota bacterium]